MVWVSVVKSELRFGCGAAATVLWRSVVVIGVGGHQGAVRFHFVLDNFPFILPVLGEPCLSPGPQLGTYRVTCAG